MTIIQHPLHPAQLALIAQACGRSDVLWVRTPAMTQPQLLWHTWFQDAVLLLGGPGEQPLPDLDDTVEVTARSKDTGAQLVRFIARAEMLAGTDPRWQQAADALSAKRLNATDPTQQQLRWAGSARIVRLQPVTMLVAGHGDDSTAAGAAAVGTHEHAPGSTAARMPFHLGGRRAGRLFGGRRDATGKPRDRPDLA